MIAGLRQLCAEREQRDELDIHLEINGERVVPPEVSACLYRITQEAFENILRHAQATRVILSLGMVGKILELSIQDDGKGFEYSLETPDDSMGIRGMQERAALIGGTLDVSSTPREGTKIIFRKENPYD